MPFYRYVSAGEAAVVQASTPWRIPNVDRFGKPKVVYFSSDYFASVAKAENALQIGAHHPGGPRPSPTDRLTLDVSGITYQYLGIVPGGTGTEYTTNDSPLVTVIAQLTVP